MIEVGSDFSGVGAFDLTDAHNFYLKGNSLDRTAKKFNTTRQRLYYYFKSKNLSTRPLFRKPFLLIDNLKFTINRDGYYECTTQDRLMLHNYNYEKHFGKIPKGHVIHHKDHNKINNKIENLECLTNSEHLKLHNSKSGWNGMCKKVKCIETNEIFNSIAEVAKKHNQHPSNVSRYYIDGKRKLNGFTYKKVD